MTSRANMRPLSPFTDAWVSGSKSSQKSVWQGLVKEGLRSQRGEWKPTMPLNKAERQAAIERARRYPEGEGGSWFGNFECVRPATAALHLQTDPASVKYG